MERPQLQLPEPPLPQLSVTSFPIGTILSRDLLKDRLTNFILTISTLTDDFRLSQSGFYCVDFAWTRRIYWRLERFVFKTVEIKVDVTIIVIRTDAVHRLFRLFDHRPSRAKCQPECVIQFRCVTFSLTITNFYK